MTHDADALPYKRSRKAQIVLAAYHMRRRRARMRDREICVMLTADEQRELLIALGRARCKLLDAIMPLGGADA